MLISFFFAKCAAIAIQIQIIQLHCSNNATCFTDLISVVINLKYFIAKAMTIDISNFKRRKSKLVRLFACGFRITTKLIFNYNRYVTQIIPSLRMLILLIQLFRRLQRGFVIVMSICRRRIPETRHVPEQNLWQPESEFKKKKQQIQHSNFACFFAKATFHS